MEFDILRQHLIDLLQGGEAYTSFEDIVAQFPAEQMNTPAPHVSYTPWHLLEHLRIAQWDILEFIRNPAHVSAPWPEGYWPSQDARTDEAGWNQTIASFRANHQALQDLVADPTTDLMTPLPHGTGQTVLREILVIADHNAYHIGEFAILRQVMQTWPSSHGE